MTAEIDQTFEKLIRTMVDHQKQVAEGEIDQSKPRPWFNLDSSEMKTPLKKKDEEELHESLKVDDIEEKYVKALNEEGAKSNELAIAKLQGDFLAAIERDMRMMIRSRIRQNAHAAARSAGNGNDKGALRSKTLDYFSRFYLKAEDKEKNG